MAISLSSISASARARASTASQRVRDTISRRKLGASSTATKKAIRSRVAQTKRSVKQYIPTKSQIKTKAPSAIKDVFSESSKVIRQSPFGFIHKAGEQFGTKKQIQTIGIKKDITSVFGRDKGTITERIGTAEAIASRDLPSIEEIKQSGYEFGKKYPDFTSKAISHVETGLGKGKEVVRKIDDAQLGKRYVYAQAKIPFPEGVKRTSKVGGLETGLTFTGASAVGMYSGWESKPIKTTAMFGAGLVMPGGIGAVSKVVGKVPLVGKVSAKYGVPLVAGGTSLIYGADVMHKVDAPITIGTERVPISEQEYTKMYRDMHGVQPVLEKVEGVESYDFYKEEPITRKPTTIEKGERFGEIFGTEIMPLMAGSVLLQKPKVIKTKQIDEFKLSKPTKKKTIVAKKDYIPEVDLSTAYKVSLGKQARIIKDVARRDYLPEALVTPKSKATLSRQIKIEPHKDVARRDFMPEVSITPGSRVTLGKELRVVKDVARKDYIPEVDLSTAYKVSLGKQAKLEPPKDIARRDYIPEVSITPESRIIMGKVSKPFAEQAKTVTDAGKLIRQRELKIETDIKKGRVSTKDVIGDEGTVLLQIQKPKVKVKPKSTKLLEVQKPKAKKKLTKQEVIDKAYQDFTVRSRMGLKRRKIFPVAIKDDYSAIFAEEKGISYKPTISETTKIVDKSKTKIIPIITSSDIQVPKPIDITATAETHKEAYEEVYKPYVEQIIIPEVKPKVKITPVPVPIIPKLPKIVKDKKLSKKKPLMWWEQETKEYALGGLGQFVEPSMKSTKKASKRKKQSNVLSIDENTFRL